MTGYHIISYADSRAKEGAPVIHQERFLTQGMKRYWRAQQLKNPENVDVIDPFRRPLSELREIYPTGTKVYRASTGGRWGKSKEVVKL